MTHITIAQLGEQVLNGLISGSGYALIALGLTLIYGVLGVINFAHGEVYMLGAYGAFVLVSRCHVNYFLALAVIIALGLLFGPLIERVVFRPISRQRKINSLIVSLGLSLVLSHFAMLVFGGTPHMVSTSLMEHTVRISGIAISYQRLVILGLTGLLILAAWLWLHYTYAGKALRAVAQDAGTAQLMGIDPNRVTAITFALATGLAAGAGALLAPLYSVTPFIGTAAGLKAFAVVVVGGFGNVQGAVVAGFLLGITESLATEFFATEYRDMVAFLVLVAVLLAWPQGLIREPSGENV